MIWGQYVLNMLLFQALDTSHGWVTGQWCILMISCVNYDDDVPYDISAK